MAKQPAKSAKATKKKPKSATKRVTKVKPVTKKAATKKKPAAKKKTTKPENRIILHRFNGDEIYRFKEAKMYCLNKMYGTGVTLWFDVDADPKALRWCEDTVKMGMSPNVSVGIDLSALDVSTLVGQQLLMPGTKTDNEDSCMSLLYYCEHQPLRNNVIDIVSRKGNKCWIRWTATTMDVNYYDGSKPLTKVEIEGEFPFKDIEKWETK